jgi:hypothetical protein
VAVCMPKEHIWRWGARSNYVNKLLRRTSIATCRRASYSDKLYQSPSKSKLSKYLKEGRPAGRLQSSREESGTGNGTGRLFSVLTCHPGRSAELATDLESVEVTPSRGIAATLRVDGGRQPAASSGRTTVRIDHYVVTKQTKRARFV